MTPKISARSHEIPVTVQEVNGVKLLYRFLIIIKNNVLRERKSDGMCNHD